MNVAKYAKIKNTSPITKDITNLWMDPKNIVRNVTGIFLRNSFHRIVSLCTPVNMMRYSSFFGNLSLFNYRISSRVHILFYILSKKKRNTLTKTINWLNLIHLCLDLSKTFLKIVQNCCNWTKPIQISPNLLVD